MIEMIIIDTLRQQMNKHGENGTAFLFGVNFEMDECFLVSTPIECNELHFDIKGVKNQYPHCLDVDSFAIIPAPIECNEYRRKFEIVHSALSRGDTFLLNLTVATKIATKLSLAEIYSNSVAPYKLYIPKRFVCFSPETFVRIENGKIYSHPMKGTIDSSVPNAKATILSDYKEQCEHNTIVDLIRNDLSQVANNVTVTQFRYVEDLGSILQVSSEIEGVLTPHYHNNIGDTIVKLLPAGSISGAPKESTIKLIRDSEGERRGFYTGIIGYFDGINLDSGVLIRYIEERKDGLYFRSGGGITARSNWSNEYNEILYTNPLVSTKTQKKFFEIIVN